MSKKKKTQQFKNQNPFRTLKGFAVSEPTPDSLPAARKTVVEHKPDVDDVDFNHQMARLGVRPLETEGPSVVDSGPAAQQDDPSEQSTEDNAFLEAMQHLQVSFADSLITEKSDESSARREPRRMKQISRGTLVPQATLDLHGARRQDVADRLTAFIANARYHGHSVLLVITGKGLHSEEGKGVLRQSVEEYLGHQGRDQVAEWGRAPRHYGGDGALILFLRQPRNGA